jgi:hypothetical protein
MDVTDELRQLCDDLRAELRRVRAQRDAYLAGLKEINQGGHECGAWWRERAFAAIKKGAMA